MSVLLDKQNRTIQQTDFYNKYLKNGTTNYSGQIKIAL